MAWTPEQQQAIDLEGQNIIVSAGAGSGKTAVLSERVLRKLKSGIHINELLVLTFTNAAAAEMKDRIRDKINETPSLKEEATLLEGSYITTFDSFALSVVKKYHTKLNVSKNITITDEVIIDLEKKRLLDEIMDNYYLTLPQSFQQLINDFCLKDDKSLKDAILNTYKKLELKYSKSTYLENYIDNYYSDSNISSFIREYLDQIRTYQENIKLLLPDFTTYFDGTYITKVNTALNKLLTATTYEDFKNLDITFPRLPNKSPLEGKKLKTAITETIEQIKNLCIYESEEEMKKEILATKSNAEIIIKILKELDYKITSFKKENELYNFTDIAHLAIKVVKENKEIKTELTNSFQEILIDEYQDTSDTQEEFISLISNNNVYMVGDIKQSIYRFRNANPYIFKNKYDAYAQNKQGIKIDLLKNFRSRKEVLENINIMFDLFMDDDIGGANYKKEHRLIFGNNDYLEKCSATQDYNLEVITYDAKNIKPITTDEQEAFIIANDIKEKVDNNYQVYDKETKKLRPVKYSDFAILLDKSKNFNLYKKIFEYHHLPLTILKDEALRKDYDILVLKNLLKLLICIKNNDLTEDFIYSYFSLGRSFLYKIPDEELYEIYINKSYQETPLYKKCQELTTNMDEMNPSAYLLYILEEFNYEEHLLLIGNIKSFRIRLEYFYNLIRNYEENGHTIYDFVSYLDELFINDYDLKFSVNEEVNNSVRIMTIHKSKGLEYPICYFANFLSEFNFRELKEKIIFDNKYGLVLPQVTDYYKDTIIKTLLKITTKKEEISEKVRLFYVALTRAREKMLIIIPQQEEELETTNLVPLTERIKYNTFLSILKSIYSAILPYTKSSSLQATKAYQKISNKSLTNFKETQPLNVTELNIPTSIMESSHYSKESLHLISKQEQELLEFGTKVHAILEQIDFTNPNIDSYPLDAKLKSKIISFLETPLIKDNLQATFYKEYEFVYQEDNKTSHGIIDLLIENDDHIIIIDYKLKNITDSAYENQLNGYRQFIKTKTNKEVSCYLYSILDSQFKEVKECIEYVLSA